MLISLFLLNTFFIIISVKIMRAGVHNFLFCLIMDSAAALPCVATKKLGSSESRFEDSLVLNRQHFFYLSSRVPQAGSGGMLS